MWPPVPRPERWCPFSYRLRSKGLAPPARRSAPCSTVPTLWRPPECPPGRSPCHYREPPSKPRHVWTLPRFLYLSNWNVAPRSQSLPGQYGKTPKQSWDRSSNLGPHSGAGRPSSARECVPSAGRVPSATRPVPPPRGSDDSCTRSEEHTSELQSLRH